MRRQCGHTERVRVFDRVAVDFGWALPICAAATFGVAAIGRRSAPAAAESTR